MHFLKRTELRGLGEGAENMFESSFKTKRTASRSGESLAPGNSTTSIGYPGHLRKHGASCRWNRRAPSALAIAH
jgi:hypothetical protein